MCIVELLLEQDLPDVKQVGQVLLISDDRMWSRVLRDALDGIAFVHRAELSEVSTRLSSQAFDLIVVDMPVDVPAESKLRDIVRQIRKYQPASRIILATDSPTWQRARESFRIGAQDYVSKSHDKLRLQTDLSKHLRF